MNFQSPKAFPVSLEKALRLWFPNVKAPDRWKIYRDFLNDDSPPLSGVKIKIEDAPISTAEALANHKAKPLDETSFHMQGRILINWRKSSISKKRQQIGQIGGNKTAKRKIKIKKL